MLALLEIGRPEHCHEVHSDRAYAMRQQLHILEGKQVRPSLHWEDPHEATMIAIPFINQGRWIVRCPCGNAPSYSPEWETARCFECGAVYRSRPPADAAKVEAVLLRRPEMKNRNWTPGETLDELQAENIEHRVDPV